MFTDHRGPKPETWSGLREGVLFIPGAEDDHLLALVAFRQELANVRDLEIKVVLVGLGPELDLFEHDRRLMAARGLLLLRRLVLELAEVHDLADRRCRSRIDFDQLQPQLLREAQRIMGGDDADLRTVGADDTHLGNSDAAADSVVVRRAGGGGIVWPWDVLSPGLLFVSSGYEAEPSL